MKEFYKLNSDGQEATEALKDWGHKINILVRVTEFELLYFKRIVILNVVAYVDHIVVSCSHLILK